jgi:predicted metal-dependent hydrolase
MEKEIYIKELGMVTLRRGSRYKRYVVKISCGKVIATMPERGDEKGILSFIDRKKSRLIQALKDHPPQPAMDDGQKAVLRGEAQRVLPGRLEALARQYGFTYSQVKISSSRTRWGSCSQRKIINLSFNLMRLPAHLVDYVLLHELCHTLEMNHSDRFWAHLDRVTEGKAQSLRKELKKY